MDAQTLIQKHEGLRLKPYSDTNGNLTIGWGHNLSNGIPRDIADRLFQYDMTNSANLCLSLFPNFGEMNSARQAALIDAAFNLGNNLKEFVHFITAVQCQDWASAKDELLDSDAARELPERYGELAKLIETGEWGASDPV